MLQGENDDDDDDVGVEGEGLRRREVLPRHSEGVRYRKVHLAGRDMVGSSGSK